MHVRMSTSTWKWKWKQVRFIFAKFVYVNGMDWNGMEVRVGLWQHIILDRRYVLRWIVWRDRCIDEFARHLVELKLL